MATKVTVHLTEDEAWPTYYYSPRPGVKPESDLDVEIDVETLERWDRVHSEYYKVQREIRDLFPDPYGTGL